MTNIIMDITMEKNSSKFLPWTLNNIGGIIKGSHFFFAWYHAVHVLLVVYFEAYGRKKREKDL